LLSPLAPPLVAAETRASAGHLPSGRYMIKKPLGRIEDRLVGHSRCEDCGMPIPPRLSLVALVIAIAITIGIFAAALTIPPI
jgi:hypothetical protein